MRHCNGSVQSGLNEKHSLPWQTRTNDTNKKIPVACQLSSKNKNKISDNLFSITKIYDKPRYNKAI